MKKLFGAAVFLTIFASANAQNYMLEQTIKIGNNNKWDYVSFDPENHNLFVSNAVQTLVISGKTKTLVGTVPHTLGVHGIAVDNKIGRAFISNGKANSIYAVDLKDFSRKDSVAVKGANPDAIMIDKYSGNIFAFNGKSSNANVFDPNTLKLIADIALPGKPEFAVSDGKGNVYVNFEEQNQIGHIDSRNNKFVAAYNIAPGEGPTGLAIDVKNNLLFSAAAGNKNLIVFDLNNKKVLKSLPVGEDADALVFDPETRKIFISNADGTLDIYKQNSRTDYKKLQTIITPKRSKTLGYDFITKEIYVPTAEFLEKKVINNSFNINVYKEN